MLKPGAQELPACAFCRNAGLLRARNGIELLFLVLFSVCLWCERSNEMMRAEDLQTTVEISALLEELREDGHLEVHLMRRGSRGEQSVPGARRP